MDFSHSCFLNAFLDNANAKHAIFTESNMSSCGMRSTDLKYSNLAGCNFARADLYRVDMTDANLDGTQFQDARELLRITASKSRIEKALLAPGALELIKLV